jgi:hypothetical protein
MEDWTSSFYLETPRDFTSLKNYYSRKEMEQTNGKTPKEPPESPGITN